MYKIVCENFESIGTSQLRSFEQHTRSNEMKICWIAFYTTL